MQRVCISCSPIFFASSLFSPLIMHSFGCGSKAFVPFISLSVLTMKIPVPAPLSRKDYILKDAIESEELDMPNEQSKTKRKERVKQMQAFLFSSCTVFILS